MTALRHATTRARWFAFPCVLLATAWAAAGDWPQFLGPQRNGLSDETGLIDHFPAAGPRLEWRIQPGEGMSGLAVVGGVIYTLVQHDGGQLALAVDAASGDTIWETQLAPEFKNPMGDGPRATPAVTEEAVYFFTGEGILAALGRDAGSQQWSHNVVKDQQGKVADYGMASSPLVVGDTVIVTIGAPSATVVAYDRTGKLSWKAGRNTPAGYSSPALLKVGETEQLVTFAGSAALGINPDDGEVLWNYPFETDFNCNIATPVSVDGGVFISSGENQGSAVLSVPAGGGAEDVKELWSSFGPRGVLHNEWQTSILLDGHLYGFDNIGSAGPTTHLTCIDASTGERKWQQLRFGKGNMIAADGKLWITTMNGELVIVRATPEKFEELGRAALFSSTRQAPVLCNGRLYLRTDDEILAVDVRATP